MQNLIEKIFVSMPSYKTKQVDEQGKPIYQDVCYPVTKDFREKLYNEIISEYEKAKDKIEEGSAEKFIAGLMKRQHYAMIEHSNVIISMSGNLYDSIRTAKDETGNYAFDLTYIHCSCVEEEGSYVMSGSFRAWRDLFLNAHEDISYMACVLYYEYPLIFKDVVESIYEEIPTASSPSG